MPKMNATAVARLAELVRAADRIFVLTGAGLSTESGISDFRGPNGLWTRNPAAARIFDIEAYRNDREVRVAAWRHRLDSEIRAAEPNTGHKILASWQHRAEVTIATQNIDGLHQRAGAQGVLELHGTFWQSRCLDCEYGCSTDVVFARVRDGEEDPPCPACGGILRTATVAFGQTLDPGTWRTAVQAAHTSDLAIAIGSSLAVQPAASLCDVALLNGARLVVLNAEATDYDPTASLVVNERIGPTLAAVDAALRA